MLMVKANLVQKADHLIVWETCYISFSWYKIEGETYERGYLQKLSPESEMTEIENSWPALYACVCQEITTFRKASNPALQKSTTSQCTPIKPTNTARMNLATHH